MDNSRYADLFLTESQEHLSAINQALLELERAPASREPVDALFRAVHTVKGMSATMGYHAVAELSHELETLLDLVRRGERRVGDGVMQALFASADALEAAIAASVAEHATAVDVSAHLARLRALSAGPAAPEAPAAPDVAGPPAAGGWAVPAPGGEGVLVRVRIAAHAELPGVRAFLAANAAKALGTVTAVAPPLDQVGQGPGVCELALRLVTDASAERVEGALRAVGDVEAVQVGEGNPVAAPPPDAPGVPSALALPGAPAPHAESGGAPAAGAPANDAPPGAGGAAVIEAPPQLKAQRSVRMDLRRLDNLMNLIGELVITRGRLTQLSSTLGDTALDETVTQASRLVSDLQDEIMSSRMVPVWQVFDRFPRLVRDAARALGKQVEFAVEGKEIELDRSLLDEIGDPVVHLLRNALDHGIELPEQREKGGKPAAGRLVLEAMRDRSAVLIRVSDDGKGIDRAKVLRKAREQGLVDGAKAELSDEELIRLISRPGFSTADRVTDISGRGVGIDAVQTRVRALGGTVEIRSQPGKGTAVTIRLPLTLAIVRSLLARVEDEVYAVPMTHVNETVELREQHRKTVKGREVLMLREDVLPLIRLRRLVGHGAAEDRTEQVIVLEIGERRAGLVVDELVGQQEIVVKQFDGVKDGLTLFSGATILGDGAPALIVDVSSLL